MAKKKNVDKISLFNTPEYGKYQKIISFDSPKKARSSAKKLNDEFNAAKTKEKKLRVARVSQYSANRAKASAKRKKLSAKERKELRKIGNIYNKQAKTLWNRYNKK